MRAGRAAKAPPHQGEGEAEIIDTVSASEPAGEQALEARGERRAAAWAAARLFGAGEARDQQAAAPISHKAGFHKTGSHVTGTEMAGIRGMIS